MVSERMIERVLRRILEGRSPTKYVPALKPTLRPWVEAIDEFVKADAHLPRRLQITAMRILEILREKHGYTGGYTMVQEYVQQLRNPDAAKAYRKTRNERYGKTKAKPTTPLDQVQAPVLVEDLTPPLESPTVMFRRSLRTPKRPEPESVDVAFAWMRSVQQGSTPEEVLRNELKDVSESELKVLQEAAVRGKLAERNKAVAVMSYVRGIHCDHICQFLHVSTGSVFRYWRAFREGGTTKLLTRRQRSDKQVNDPSVREKVFAVLHAPPSSYGFNRTTWTIADLEKAISAQGKHVGAATIRTLIKESGFRWKHARVVLTSNDPEYKEKVLAIQKLLGDLSSDEAFFSIDEYGPFAIKMKGGKKRVGPGEQYVVPQWQKSRGWTILTAALELSTNQVTHFYSKKKNTGEMIRMADVLRTQYRSLRTIYLSWDAASWHVSKELTAHLERINRSAPVEGYPVVKTMPLPARSQFLNVIESVFSGMARAIIHNSNYPSVEAAHRAIDRHFGDRNQHFRDHPQRAGKMLWGLERVPSSFSEAQNCKDPVYQYIV